MQLIRKYIAGLGIEIHQVEGGFTITDYDLETEKQCTFLFENDELQSLINVLQAIEDTQ